MPTPMLMVSKTDLLRVIFSIDEFHILQDALTAHEWNLEEKIEGLEIQNKYGQHDDLIISLAEHRKDIVAFHKVITEAYFR